MSDVSQLFAAKANAEINDLNGLVTACSSSGNAPVLGSGNALADILVAKLIPDTDEESEGVAFAGRSGEAILKAAERLSVPSGVLYGTNLLKCGARSRTCDEKCHELFTQELAIVQPRLVLAMGEPVFAAACAALGHNAEFSPGAVARRAGRATVVGSVDFADAMSDEAAKKQLWHDLQALGALYSAG